jgi:saccharopine dehydrogenase-like NADP-dependent oxidoreductase
MVAATTLAEGEKLEKVLKDLVAEAKKEQPEIAKMITLDKESHEGVKFHVATVPVTEPEAAEVLGKTVDIVLGIGPDSLYVAAGKKAIETVKKVIDKSKAEPGKSISPLQISVAGTAIAKFAAAVIPMDDAKQQAEKIAALLAQSGGKDHVTLVATGIPNGMNMRLTVEEGILKAAPAMGVGGPEAKAKRKAAIQKE